MSRRGLTRLVTRPLNSRRYSPPANKFRTLFLGLFAENGPPRRATPKRSFDRNRQARRASQCVGCERGTHSHARRACILLYLWRVKIRYGIARREGEATCCWQKIQEPDVFNVTDSPPTTQLANLLRAPHLEEFDGCTEYSGVGSPISLVWVPTDQTVRMEAHRNDFLDLQAD